MSIEQKLNRAHVARIIDVVKSHAFLGFKFNDFIRVFVFCPMVIVLLVVMAEVVKECSDIFGRIVSKGFKPIFDSLSPLLTLFRRV